MPASLYAGARSRLERADLPGLGPRFALQPKLDGAYCTAILDDAGRISNLISRAGKPFAPRIAADLLGVRAGDPGSVLVGEIEAHTEAGNRAASTRGYRCLHLFDALRIGPRSVADLPYRTRRDLLLRSRAQLELEVGADKPEQHGSNGAGRDSSGRFSAPIPTSWRRCPIVPQLAPALADRAWSEWVDGGEAEGLVAVALDAPLGRRGSKRKVKPAITLDCTVLSTDRRRVTLHWSAADVVFTVGRRKGIECVPGSVVEVQCDGFYEASNEPRFARLVRARSDLTAMVGA